MKCKHCGEELKKCPKPSNCIFGGFVSTENGSHICKNAGHEPEPTEAAPSLKKISDGIYSSQTKPGKVDDERVHEIMSRGPNPVVGGQPPKWICPRCGFNEGAGICKRCGWNDHQPVVLAETQRPEMRCVSCSKTPEEIFKTGIGIAGAWDEEGKKWTCSYCLTRPEMGINWQDLYQRTEDFLYAIREEFNIRPYKTNAIDHCTVIRLLLRGKLAAASGTENVPDVETFIKVFFQHWYHLDATSSIREAWKQFFPQPSSLTQAGPVRKPLPKGWWGWNAKGEPIEKMPIRAKRNGKRHRPLTGAAQSQKGGGE